MAKLTVVYWRDIPAQVIAKQGRKTEKKVLADRFAVAIDKAAMRAGMAGTDGYLEQWRRVDQNCTGDLRRAVDDLATQLELEFDEQRLTLLISQGGAAEA